MPVFVPVRQQKRNSGTKNAVSVPEFFGSTLVTTDITPCRPNMYLPPSCRATNFLAAGMPGGKFM